METRPADDVGHEGVAGDEAASGQSSGKGIEVETVALAGPSLREVAFEDCRETPLAEAFDGAVLARKRQAARELAQEREQRQIGPRGRLEPVCSDSGTATAPRAIAARRVGSSSRKATFRFTIPLR